MCTFELHVCNSALGQSSQNLKMHRLMVTAAKLFFIQTIFKSFSLFVRKTSSRQPSYSLHQLCAFINCLLRFQNSPEFLMSSHTALPAFIGVVTVTTVWKETHMDELRGVTHCSSYADNPWESLCSIAGGSPCPGKLTPKT